jgi:tRNA A-37 threonylcarbamoyl transferase component Bud32
MRGELSAGTLIGGDFEIERRLSGGGMGEVYVARQRSTGALRALKRLHAHLVADPVMRARFEREAKVVARIESQHVVQVLAAGVDEARGEPFIAMELLRGATLAQHIKGGALPWPEARRIARGVGHALAAAHRAGVVHRDLKPENVMLAESQLAGMDSIVKVLDFGISLVAKGTLAERLTGGLSIGSPACMAPEQFTDSERVGPAADVWAMGLLVFEMLTGRRFWDTDLRSEAALPLIIQEVVEQPIPPSVERARSRGASLDPSVGAWIDACLQRDPALRFRDAQAALRAFESLPESLAASPVAQSSTTLLERPAPHATTKHRNGGAVIIGVAVIGVGVAVAIGVGVGAVMRVRRDAADEAATTMLVSQNAAPPVDAVDAAVFAQPMLAQTSSPSGPDAAALTDAQPAAETDQASGDAARPRANTRRPSGDRGAPLTPLLRDAMARQRVLDLLVATGCLDRFTGREATGVLHAEFDPRGVMVDFAHDNVRVRVSACIQDRLPMGSVRGARWLTPYRVQVSFRYREP